MNFNDVKRWWVSRTIWFGHFLVVAGALLEYVNTNSSLLTPYFGKWGGIASIAIGAATILLRLVTKHAIGKPEPVKAGGTD